MGNFLTREDLLAEGLAAEPARLDAVIELVEAIVEQVTGFRFWAHDATVALDGTGADVLTLPQPCLRLDAVTADGDAVAATEYTLVSGRPPGRDDRLWPRLVRLAGRTWPRGVLNVTLQGRWGFTEARGDAEVAPAPVRRAAVMLAAVELGAVGDPADASARLFRVAGSSLSAGGVSFSVARDAAESLMTRVPDVDAVLRRYRHASRGVVFGAARPAAVVDRPPTEAVW